MVHHPPHSDINPMILNLTEPVANLITTAVIKSNLVNTLQEQMRHLQRLNDVSQQLTSTLNMKLVLQRIIDSALEILHAESGSLMIINDTKDELLIQIATGGTWTQLLGRVIPVNQGIAGKTFAKRQSTICNEDVLEKMMKWEGVDQNSLIINNILAVPLIVG